MKIAGFKRLISVCQVYNSLKLKQEQEFIDMADDELKEVFRDGKLLIDYSLNDIRERIGGSLT